MKAEMQKNKFLIFKKIFLLIFLLNIIQACTSSVEVAASLGKKFLIPKDNKKSYPTPIYKIGNKYEVNGKFYYPKKDMFYSKSAALDERSIILSLTNGPLSFILKTTNLLFFKLVTLTELGSGKVL